MSYAFPPDVQQMIADRLASGSYSNEDEVLRDALRVLQELDDESAAVQAAIDEWREGDDGIPLDQAFESLPIGDGTSQSKTRDSRVVVRPPAKCVSGPIPHR